MNVRLNVLTRLIRREPGVGLAEFALLLCLLVIVVAVASLLLESIP